MLDEVIELISIFLAVAIAMRWNREISYSWDVCAEVFSDEYHDV